MYEFLGLNLAQLMSVFLVLVALTEGITELLKGIIKGMTNNMIAILIGQIVTLASFYIYIQWQGIPSAWGILLTVIIYGLAVGFGAMYGYDKIKQWLDQKFIIKNKLTNAEGTD